MRHAVYELVTELYSQHLIERWNTITIGGKTIQDRYGISLETAKKYRLGFAPSDLSLRDWLLTQNVTIEEDGQPHAVPIDSRLIIQNRGWGLLFNTAQPAATQNYFSGRIIFPYLLNGQPVYFSARTTDDSDARDWKPSAKYLHLSLDQSGLSDRPLYLEPVRRQTIILVEGHFHALKLREEGFCGVAIGGSLPNAAQIAALRDHEPLYLIPDVDKIMMQRAQVQMFDDGKRFTPGQTREEKLAAFLPLIRRSDDGTSLPQCRIVRYPDDFSERHEKGDMNDWWQEHPNPADFISQLLEPALYPDEVEILSIPRNLPPLEKADRIRRLIPFLSARSQLENSSLFTLIRSHLDIPATDIQALKKEIRAAKQSGVSITRATPESAIRLADCKEIYPGQDYAGGRLIYTINVRDIVEKNVGGDVVEEVVTVPYLITSRGEYFRATSTEMLKHNLYWIQGCSADTMQSDCWSQDPRVQYSVPNWLKDRQANHPDAKQLVNDLRTFFKAHCYLEHDEYYDFAIVFAFVTYCAQRFQTCGYWALTGNPGSGKSELMNLEAAVSYDPIKSSTTSDAAMFHATERGATMFFDEAEKFFSLLKTKETVSEQTLIANGGYKKGQFVNRMVESGDQHVMHAYRCFGPKMFGNTRGYYASLYTRMIHIIMAKAPADIHLAPFDPEAQSDQLSHIRNRIFCFIMNSMERIDYYYRAITTEFNILFREVIGLRNREMEIWRGYFTLAMTIDEACGCAYNGYENGELKLYPSETNGPLLCQLIKAHGRLTQQKRQVASSKNNVSLVLAALRLMLDENLVSDTRLPNAPEARASHWFKVKEVTNWLHTIEGLEYFPKQTGESSLKPLLMRTVAGKRKKVVEPEDVQYWGHTKAQRAMYIRIDPERIHQACLNEDVPSDVDIEFIERKDGDRSSGKQEELEP